MSEIHVHLLPKKPIGVNLVVRQPKVVVAGRGLQGAVGERGPVGDSTSSYVAGAAVSGHSVLTMDSNGEAIYADSTNPTHADSLIGVSTGAAAQGDTVYVKNFGLVQHQGWSLTPGEPVFLGTGGQITQTAPTTPGAFVKQLGRAQSTTSFVLNIQPAIFIA